MDQSSQDAWLCQTFEVSAGFAVPRSAQADGSDLELLTHEMIQRHASGDYVSELAKEDPERQFFRVRQLGIGDEKASAGVDGVTSSPPTSTRS